MAPSDRFRVSVREDKTAPGGGHAVITVGGVAAVPADPAFAIRRIGFDRDNLGPEGWRGPEAKLLPLSVRPVNGGLELRIGPAVVDRIVVGTPVEIEIPALGVKSTLHWPDIAPSVGGPDAGRRRVVGTGRARVPVAVPAAAPVVEAPPPPEPAPPSEPPPPPPEPAVEEAEEKTIPFAPLPDLTATAAGEPRPAPPEEPVEPDRKRGLAFWLVAGGAGLLVLLLLAGTAWMLAFRDRPAPPPPQIAQSDPPPPVTPPPVTPPVMPEPPPQPPGPPAPAVETPPPPPITPPATPPPEPDPSALLRLPNIRDLLPWLPDLLRRPETAQETVRRLRDSGLPPAELVRRGEEYLRQGQPDPALLLFEVAGDRNYGPALTAIGRMYDPVHFGQGRSPFARPNPSMAASWYQRARELGDPNAAAAQAALRDWLRSAAARGDPEAAQALRDWF